MCSATRYWAAKLLKFVPFGCPVLFERRLYRCDGVLEYLSFLGSVDCCMYVVVVGCVVFFTLGSAAGTISGTVFSTLGSAVSFCRMSSNLLVRCSMVEISNKAFVMGSPARKLGVVVDGGCVSMSTMSSAACRRWSSKDSFGMGISCGTNVTVSQMRVVLVRGK